MKKNKDSLFSSWFDAEECSVDAVQVLNERTDGREVIFDSLVIGRNRC